MQISFNSRWPAVAQLCSAYVPSICMARRDIDTDFCLIRPVVHIVWPEYTFASIVWRERMPWIAASSSDSSRAAHDPPMATLPSPDFQCAAAGRTCGRLRRTAAAAAAAHRECLCSCALVWCVLASVCVWCVCVCVCVCVRVCVWAGCVGCGFGADRIRPAHQSPAASRCFCGRRIRGQPTLSGPNLRHPRPVGGLTRAHAYDHATTHMERSRRLGCTVAPLHACPRLPYAGAGLLSGRRR